MWLKQLSDQGARRIFLLLAAAFFVVGLTATYTISAWQIGTHRRANESGLIDLAQVLANQIANPIPGETPEQFSSSLDLSLKKSRQFSRAQILDLQRDRYVVSYDTGRQTKGIRQPAKVPPSILAPLSRGKTTIVDNGSFSAAYVPMGEVGAAPKRILALESPFGLGDSLDEQLSAFRLSAVFLVLALSLILASLLTRFLVIHNVDHVTNPGPTRSGVRSVLLEAILISMVGTVMLAGLFSHLSASAESKAMEAQWGQDYKLQQMRDEIARAMHSGHLNIASLSKVRRLAFEAGLPWIAFRIDRSIRSGSDNELRMALTDIEQEQAQQMSLRKEQIETSSDRSSLLLTLFGISMAISVAALVLIRTTTRQQYELERAVESINHHQNVYQQLVEQLPIGLCSLRDGEILLSNQEWDRQTKRQPEGGATEAFQVGLHPEDRDRVTSELRSHQIAKKPFVIRYRLYHWGSEPKFYECHGVPILDDQCELKHILAFQIDTTKAELARLQLEIKNAEIQEKNDLLRQANAEMESNLKAMVGALAKAVEAKDVYTAGHSERVMEYSMSIGEALGLSIHDLQVLKMGTLIHDIGKIGIPDAILNKPGFLTDAEFEYIRAHPVIGYDTIKDIPLFEECAPIVRWHHERLDGNGYPDGLREDEIPLLVRIASVADVFDAITSARAYKLGKSTEAAVDELRKEAIEGRLDAQVVEILADIVARDGILEQLELSERLQSDMAS